MNLEYDDSGLFTIVDEPDELDETNELHPIEAEDVPGYLMPSKVYDILKWVGLILCYALAILARKVGAIWGIDVAAQVADTIEAVGLFIGMCIGASHLTATGR